MKFHVRSFRFLLWWLCCGHVQYDWGREGRGAASVENVKKWLSLSLSQNGISLFDYVYKCLCL